MASASGSGTASSVAKDGEAYYKSQLEIIWKEKTQLKERLETLERENRDLRRSVYELSLRRPIGSGNGIFDVDAALGRAAAAAATSSNEPLSSPLGGSETDIAEISLENTGSNFVRKLDMAGHTGAVYTVSFSPCGQFLASGSFDRSLRIWGVHKNVDSSANLSIFEAHQANIVTVAWSSDSTMLFSGGYDHMAKEWDIAGQRTSALVSYHANGFVQAVAISPVNEDLLYVGTSRHKIHCFDRRAPGGDGKSALLVENDSMVNTLYIQRNGTHIISGDHHGAIKTWDTRNISENAVPESIVYNDQEHRPITHVHVSPVRDDDDEGRFLAVNSYDNYLRVYDRGNLLWGSSGAASFKPLYALKGPINRSWPIKSAFFRGGHYRPMPKADMPIAAGSPDMDDILEDHSRAKLSTTNRDTGIHGTLTLASGSADANVYIYDVGVGNGVLTQVLRGHTDRVYCTSFHPTQPILATCSADQLIKIWTPVRSNPNLT